MIANRARIDRNAPGGNEAAAPTLAVLARLVFLVLALAIVLPAPARADDPAPDGTVLGARVELVIFWEPGCPYCLRARDFLARLDPSVREWLTIEAYDISEPGEAQRLFEAVNRAYLVENPAVPLVVVGGIPFIGYDTDETTGREILAEAEACRAGTCPSLSQALAYLAEHPLAPELPHVLKLPFLGEVEIASLSLPALTILLGAVDGFNPCAMWVLVFLIGLLVGMRDRARMWILGGTFLLASGAVYFGFLAAWLNLFLLLGALLWVRLAVGLVAILSGAYYLREFAMNTAAECKVTNPAQRQRIMAAFRASVGEKRFLVALAGIVVLAVAVNAIELFCSAGIPAVYTQILARAELPAAGHYAYLLLYVIVFMIDDLAIFAIAMVTLAATGMTTRYLRVSHLVGGLAMATIGLLLIFAPDRLNFFG
ncbi:MAG TPA: glutaredoxin [Kaistiaceae bacterium]|nr:glutaredoxin [Kaistiaceae bacterium]